MRAPWLTFTSFLRGKIQRIIKWIIHLEKSGNSLQAERWSRSQMSVCKINYFPCNLITRSFLSHWYTISKTTLKCFIFQTVYYWSQDSKWLFWSIESCFAFTPIKLHGALAFGIIKFRFLLLSCKSWASQTKICQTMKPWSPKSFNQNFMLWHIYFDSFQIYNLMS